MSARNVGLVLGAAVLAFGVAVALTALPLFAFARFVEPGSGLDRPVIRSGLRLVIPVSVLAGVVAAGVTGRWLARRPG